MSYLSLYRKWRSSTFDEVLGQAHVTETLAGALRNDRLSHAYLFAGPRGTGKTSTARILAKALNCQDGPTPTPCGKCSNCLQIADGSSLDVYEMDAASHTSVDDVREIRDRIPFASVGGGHKVYIIDEAHQLSTPAFNALLKMLEEPPPHVVFVLCTTESHRLPATVISRCQRFEFRRLPADLVSGHLARVAAEEGISAAPDALDLIARHGRGSVRDALSLLDQAAATASGEITRETVTEILGEAPEDVLCTLAEAVAEADIASVFRGVEAMIQQGWDPRQLLRQLLETFRSVYLVASGASDLVDADDAQRTRLGAVAQKFSSGRLEWAMRALGDGQADMRLTTHPRLTLDVALARAATPAAAPDALVARIEVLERAVQSAGGARPAAPAPVVRTPPSPPAATPASPDATPAPEAVGEKAPVAPEPSPVVPPVAAPRAVPDDGSLEGKWAALLDAVKTRKRTTHALIKEGWPVELSGGVLKVGFERPFHAEEIHKPLHTAHLQSALEEVFGEKLRIRSELVESGRPDPRAAEPGAAAQADEAGADLSPVDLVVRGLGGEVVDEVDGA